MSGSQIEGGAGSALAAHSKDASASGSTPASAAAGSREARQNGGSGLGSDSVTQVAEQTLNAANQAADTVSQAFDQGRQRLLPAGSSEQIAGFVRERPFAALLGAGAAGLVVGLLLGRR